MKNHLQKDISLDEVVARVNAHLRIEKVKNNNLQFGDLILDLKTSDIINKNNNEKINIINKEFQLLEYFMNNPNQVLSKKMIYDKVWGLEKKYEGEILLTLDKTSKITLTGDTYIKVLNNTDSTNSNINLNGYKLYVNGIELKK